MMPPHKRDLDENQTQDTTNPHEHWSQWPIRRSAPVNDNWQMPDWKQHKRKSCKGTLSLYTETLDPMEQTARHCHRGNEHGPSHKGPMTLLGTSKSIYLTQESFTLPCILSYYSFHLCNLLTGAFVQIEVQIQKPTSTRESPSFPFTSQPHWAYPFTNP